MVSFKIGTVNAYYAKLSMMAVDLTADIHLKDTIVVNNQPARNASHSDAGGELIIKIIKIGYEKVECGKRGETVVINADFPVAIGDELVRT